MKEGKGATCSEKNVIETIGGLQNETDCQRRCDAVGNCKFLFFNTDQDQFGNPGKYFGSCMLYRACGMSSKPFPGKQFRRKEGNLVSTKMQKLFVLIV